MGRLFFTCQGIIRYLFQHLFDFFKFLRFKLFYFYYYANYQQNNKQKKTISLNGNDFIINKNDLGNLLFIWTLALIL